jgi:hypothetical protein
LHVHAGSAFWHGAGLGAVIAGALTMVVGAIVAGSGSGSDAHQTAITGGEIAGAGLAALAVGALVWLTSATSVTTDDGRAL